MHIRIAGLNIEITSINVNIACLLKEYIIEDDFGDCDFNIIITKEDIEQERKMGVNADFANIQMLEYTAIFRKICLKVLEYHAFFLHSSVVVVDDKAYAFAAKAGTGKSTHTNLWVQHFGDRSYIINGDKPIYRFIGKQLYVCGHPWAGKEGLHRNKIVPLAGLCFLTRGKNNLICKMEKDKVIEHVFQQVLLPQDETLMIYLLEMMNRFILEVPCYLLECNMSKEAVEVAYNEMTEIDKI